MAHLLFIGGTRFIGHAAVVAAVARGHRVTVLHRGTTTLECEGVSDVFVDRRDPSALTLAVARAKADVVVDTRAMSRADAEATGLACETAGAPLVVLSSFDVYAQFGRLNGLPCAHLEDVVTEQSPLTVPKPFQALGVPHEGGPDYDKKDVEAHFRERASRVPTTILRLPGVFGARDPKRRFGAIVDAIDGTGTSDGPSDQQERELPCRAGAPLRLTHAHVANVAHAIALAAERRAAERAPRAGEEFLVFNVGERHTPTMAERVALFARVIGKTVRLVEADDDAPLAPELALLGPLANDLVVSSAKIRQTLGFQEVVSDEDAARDLVQWLRKSRR